MAIWTEKEIEQWLIVIVVAGGLSVVVMALAGGLFGGLALFVCSFVGGAHEEVARTPFALAFDRLDVRSSGTDVLHRGPAWRHLPASLQVLYQGFKLGPASDA